MDLYSSHRVVNNRADDGDVVAVIDSIRSVVVELLTPLIPALASSIGIVRTTIRVFSLLSLEPVFISNTLVIYIFFDDLEKDLYFFI